MLTEAEYLEQQATQALARMRRTARTLADEVMAPLAIQSLIRRRPWLSLGAAAASGFGAGLGLRHRRGRARVGHVVGRFRGVLAKFRRSVWPVLKSALGAILAAELKSLSPTVPTARENHGNGIGPPRRDHPRP